MKKTFAIIVAFALTTTVASALSFDWSSKSIKFDSTNLKNSTAVTGYLIYLGSGGSLDTTYDVTKDSTASSIIGSIGTDTGSSKSTPNALGKLTGTYVFDYGTKANGDTFAMLLSYNDGENTYFNLSSTVVTLSGIVDETSDLDAMDFTSGFSYSNAGESKTITAGGGWIQAVPEPSTAALALAGLALLLKRRKA